MISIETLKDHRTGPWVVFDKHGNILDREIPGDVGPAALLVSEVTEALKRVDEADRIVESLDRSQMWLVEGILLNEVILDKLSGEMDAPGLLEAVRAAGYAWQIRPISGP